MSKGLRDDPARKRLLADRDDEENLDYGALGEPNGQSTPNAAVGQQDQSVPTAESDSTPDGPSTGKVLAIMGSIWVCTFFAALDGTVVVTLSGPISAEFESGTAYSWIASAYLIANAACQPLSGKITDIYGRRAGLIYASTFFAAGTLICASATTVWTMVLGRVIAGMGGGCLNTISTFVGSDLVPLRRRGLWQGMANIVYGTGMSLGGVYGGLIHGYLGWRYAFYIQVPFIILGGICSSIMVRLPPKIGDKKRIKRVDFLGAFVLVATLVCLLLGLNSGGNTVPWNHPLVLVSLPLSAVGLVLFAFIEEKVASEPIIPVRLLLNRTVAAGCAAYWFATMSEFMLMFYVVIYIQVVQGASPPQAGVLLIPETVGMALGSLTVGYVMRRTGTYWTWNAGNMLLLVTADALILATFNMKVGGPPGTPYILLLMNGLAYGGMLTATFIGLIGGVEHQYHAVITSASYAFRSMGSSMGIAIGGAILQNVLGQRLTRRFGDQPGAADEIHRIRDSMDELAHLPPGWHDGVIASYVEALRGVWVAALALAALTAIASLLMREHVLHRTIQR